MEEAPVEAVDSTLLGYWYGIIKDGSDFFGIEALEITRKSDSVYAITRYGKAIKGDMILPDTSYYTGYTSWIGSTRFMNVEGSVWMEDRSNRKKPQMRQHKVFYVTSIDNRNDTMQVRAITENFSARKFFSHSNEFRQHVTEMLDRNPDIYDVQYSLKYRKIPKPEQIFPGR